MGARSISKIGVWAPFAWGVSAAATGRRTTDAVLTGSKVTPNDTTRQMRLNGLRSQAAWTSCLLMMRQQAYVSSGIVGV